MRAIIALSLLLLTSLAQAEDLEQFTLADGRVLIGSYDEAAGKLTLVPAKGGKLRVALSVAAKDIADRKPWVDPVEAARLQAAAEEAKRAKAEAEAEQSRTASRAVRATIEAQDQRIKDRERQAADKVTRELARERAAYWRARGQEFDPLIFSADEMDEQAAAAQRRKDAEAQRAAAEVAWKLKLEEDKARAAAVERAQAEQRRIDRATDAERERIIAANQAKDEEAAADDRRSEERKQATVAAAKATVAITGILILVVVVVAAYLIPVIIAFHRFHKFRWPITVLCVVCPLLLGGGWACYSNSQLAAAVGSGVAAAIGGVFGVVAWLGGLFWAVMPGQGQPRPPKPDAPAPAPAPGAPPGRRRPRAPAPKPAAAAMPAEAPASPNPGP